MILLTTNSFSSVFQCINEEYGLVQAEPIGGGDDSVNLPFYIPRLGCLQDPRKGNYEYMTKIEFD